MGYTLGLAEVFDGPLRGKWPALPVYLTLLALADDQGHVDCSPRAICAASGFPDELLREGVAHLESLGLITKLHSHLNWGWALADFRKPRLHNGRLPASQWAVVRASVFQRDDYTCRYCGERGGRLECDHVVPISAGGDNDPSNLVTACFACNRSKRDKPLALWFSEVRS